MGRIECHRTRERISLDLDGELSLHESALLERHLSYCSECALFADDVRHQTGLLRAAPLEQPPPFAIPKWATARRFSVRVGAAVASTAAAALVAVSVMSYGKPTASHRVDAPVFHPSGVVVARATDGLNGLRHPTALQPLERPTLGLLQDASQHGVVDNN